MSQTELVELRLDDIKVGKRKPFTIDNFDEFFRLLPKRANTEHSWTIDFSKRKKQAAKEAQSFKKLAQAKQQEANRWKERLAKLKRTMAQPSASTTTAPGAI